MRTFKHFLVLSPLACLLVAGSANGVTIDWADWTASNLAVSSGTVGGVAVSFSGLLKFAQLDAATEIGGSSGRPIGTNFWTEGDPAPYTGNAVVGNAPTPNELLAFYPPSQNALTFASPVVNPIIAIVSQGQPGVPVTYAFDTPFTVLSEGLGYWGNGSYSLSGNSLTGYEFHGVIQFPGTVQVINWSSTAENWHGFTVGVPRTGVSDGGATLLLLGVALSGVAALRRRHG